MSVEFYPLLFVSTACCDVTGAERKKFNDQEIRLGCFSVHGFCGTAHGSSSKIIGAKKNRALLDLRRYPGPVHLLSFHLSSISIYLV